jgi:phosphohistidine phosphatase
LFGLEALPHAPQPSGRATLEAIMSRALSLYLVRHGIAAERGEAYPDDDVRPLTPDGVTKFRKAVKGLARLGVSVDVILTSPLLRARQTAQILAKGLGDTKVVDTDALRPGGRFDRLVRTVTDSSGHTAIAIVGHEPEIGQAAGRLVGKSGPLAFNKGAVCRIDFDKWPMDQPGRLRWFVTQKILRKMG